MSILYNFTISAYHLLIKIAALFNSKARLWVNGRKNLFERLHQETGNNKDSLVWFHAASLGEFEQGRPVMEAFRKKYPSFKIMLTFFSPSGYEIRKNYDGADYIFYLPMDSRKNAEQFIQLTKPRLRHFCEI